MGIGRIEGTWCRALAVACLAVPGEQGSRGTEGPRDGRGRQRRRLDFRRSHSPIQFSSAHYQFDFFLLSYIFISSQSSDLLLYLSTVATYLTALVAGQASPALLDLRNRCLNWPHSPTHNVSAIYTLTFSHRIELCPKKDFQEKAFNNCPTQSPRI